MKVIYFVTLTVTLTLMSLMVAPPLQNALGGDQVVAATKCKDGYKWDPDLGKCIFDPFGGGGGGGGGGGY